jgi:hypothetical protein
MIVAALPLGAGGGAQPTPAQVGAALALLVARFAPAVLYDQLHLVLGMTGPDPAAVDQALSDAQATAAAWQERLRDDPHWPATREALATVHAMTVDIRVALASPAPDAREELRARFGELWTTLDALGAAAAREAREMGEEWSFHAASLAQGTLLAPSPLYLRLPVPIKEYLDQERPDWLPTEAGAALDVLLAMANCWLAVEEEVSVRQAADALLAALLGLKRGGGGR